MQTIANRLFLQLKSYKPLQLTLEAYNRKLRIHLIYLIAWTALGLMSMNACVGAKIVGRGGVGNVNNTEIKTL